VGVRTGLSPVASVGLSVCPVGSLWKTAHWIWVLFGIVGSVEG